MNVLVLYGGMHKYNTPWIIKVYIANKVNNYLSSMLGECFPRVYLTAIRTLFCIYFNFRFIKGVPRLFVVSFNSKKKEQKSIIFLLFQKKYCTYLPSKQQSFAVYTKLLWIIKLPRAYIKAFQIIKLFMLENLWTKFSENENKHKIQFFLYSSISVIIIRDGKCVFV